MMEAILLSTSPREGGNTDAAAEVVADAVAGRGMEAVVVHLRDFRIERCRGCLGCQLGRACPVEDDFGTVWDRVKRSRTIVLFIPVYWCSPPGLMKDFMDRTVVDIQKDGVMRGKAVHLVSIAQSAGFEPQEKVVDQWVRWLGGASLFSKVRLIAFHKGELGRNANAMRKLRKLGGTL